MKSMNINSILIALLFSSLCFAENEQQTEKGQNPIEEQKSLPNNIEDKNSQERENIEVKPIQTLTVETLDFDQLSNESKTGYLAQHVKADASSETTMLGIRMSIGSYQLQPYSETLAYVNGVLCHIGNYSESIIYTVLEGPYYGLQTVTSYSGRVLYINGEYEIEVTPIGNILHHFYYDSEVITGSNQVIIF